MRAYLLQMKVNGIKNISQEVTLNFYNKTVPQGFKVNDSNIKSIYGPNVSWKSELINAVYIYQNILLNSNYLGQSTTTSLLNELINKKSNHLSIEISFLLYDEELQARTGIYTHRVELKKVRGESYDLVYEKLRINMGSRYDSARGKTIIEVRNGEVVYTDYQKQYARIEKYLINLMNKQSITAILLQKDRESLVETDEDQGYIQHFWTAAFLGLNMSVIVGESDRHYNFLMKQKYIDYAPEVLKEILLKMNISEDTDIIVKKDYEEYQRNITKLSRFIRIFKEELQSIDIEKKEDRNCWVCEKYFNYGDYRVQSEFESTGIKKLIVLFNVFHKFVNGEIVFIDELDANLHDVYLCKMLEYFSQYAKGQLCFTTHNLAPMEILKKRNYSIDFLSSQSTLTGWKKNGNYSVIKLYREGMIQDSPFNVEAFDFIGIFDEE